ncbi:MAG: hypothetical protein V2I43_09145 [Parvularcula sp.]|nr:hypothetical protein [Parvularcula sp.]
MAKGSGFRANLQLLYREYGGVYAVLTSFYFWFAILISGLLWPVWNGPSENYLGVVLSVMPALAGFSIAGFSLVFSVLDHETRKVLAAPAEELGNRSPLLQLLSSVAHAILVQVTAILVALVIDEKPFPSMSWFAEYVLYANRIWAFIGFSIFLYGLALIVATTLSIVQIVNLIYVAPSRKGGEQE